MRAEFPRSRHERWSFQMALVGAVFWRPRDVLTYSGFGGGFPEILPAERSRRAFLSSYGQQLTTNN